jgi:SAM-dependent methyltransferase
VRPGEVGVFHPHCPACRLAGRSTALAVAAWEETSGQGVLSCETCGSRYPVLDHLPLLVPDVARYLAEAGVYLLARDDLSHAVADLIGAMLPPGIWFDAMRQHVSGYVRDHWADAADTDGPPPGQAAALAAAGLKLAGEVSGPVVELGASAGGVARCLAEWLDAPVLGLDLSAPLARFAARALRGGRQAYPLRIAGTAYAERHVVTAPPARGMAEVWLADAIAPPVADGVAGLVVALNLLDCVADPAALLRSAAALLRPGGKLVLATPCDWSPTATPPEAWIGARRTAEAMPDLGAWAASQSGLRLLGAEERPWLVRVHARAAMQYRASVIALERV